MTNPGFLVVIAGPTAIGKTDLAIKVAQHFQTEIISADSRQFYREMSIGTAKPNEQELKSVPHHFINSHSVNDTFTVGDFEEQGLALINRLLNHHNIVVLAGGSGLFVRAITEGFDTLPKAPLELRNQLNQLYQQQGIGELQKQLQALDPLYFSEVDINNPQRLIRALEVCISTGSPFSSYRVQNMQSRPFHIIKIGLNTDREILYDRINRRVDAMVSMGLVDEVKSLLQVRHLNALNTVGYSEIFEYLDGKITLQGAIDQIKQNTRRFAKRQLTWFRKEGDMNWFNPEQVDEIIDFITKETKRRA